MGSEFGSEGLVILGFPTAQFDNQEPGDGQEILNCLKHVRPGNGFIPAFQLMAKGPVNGHDEHAMWAWLKDHCQLPATFNYGSISWSPVKAHDVSWNFEKFLLDRDGKPCRRYNFETPAAELRQDIAGVLKDGCRLQTCELRPQRLLERRHFTPMAA